MLKRGQNRVKSNDVSTNFNTLIYDHHLASPAFISNQSSILLLLLILIYFIFCWSYSKNWTIKLMIGSVINEYGRKLWRWEAHRASGPNPQPLLISLIIMIYDATIFPPLLLPFTTWGNLSLLPSTSIFFFTFIQLLRFYTNHALIFPTFFTHSILFDPL